MAPHDWNDIDISVPVKHAYESGFLRGLITGALIVGVICGVVAFFAR